MWCNNGWNTRSCGCRSSCGCQNSCGCNSGCDCGGQDDFSMEQVGTLPVFVSVPTWLANGQSAGTGCGCG